MPDQVTTQRRTGEGGKVVLKNGTTSVETGADTRKWSWEEKCNVVDVTGKADAARVIQRGTKSASGSYEMLVADDTSLGKVKAGDILTVELFGGVDPDAPTTPLTDADVKATVIVTGVSKSSGTADEAETVNVSFEASGAWAYTSA